MEKSDSEDEDGDQSSEGFVPSGEESGEEESSEDSSGDASVVDSDEVGAEGWCGQTWGAGWCGCAGVLLHLCAGTNALPAVVLTPRLPPYHPTTCLPASVTIPLDPTCPPNPRSCLITAHPHPLQDDEEYSGGDEEEDEGLSWEELEAEAEKADRQREDADSEDERSKARKRKGGSGAAAPAVKKRR